MKVASEPIPLLSYWMFACMHTACIFNIKSMNDTKCSIITNSSLGLWWPQFTVGQRIYWAGVIGKIFVAKKYLVSPSKIVLTSKWGRIQPQIQIWLVAGRPWTWAEMISELRSAMTPSSPTVQWHWLHLHFIANSDDPVPISEPRRSLIAPWLGLWAYEAIAA